MQLNMTKRQKLALHRTDSNFSLKNPLNYKLALLTEDYIRQTPEEREEIAKAKWTPSMIGRKCNFLTCKVSSYVTLA